MTRPSPPGLAPRSIAGSLVRVSSLTASVQVEQPFALPRSAGCDSSECSVCHWEQTACAKRHRFLDTTTSAVGAATASRRSSLQSSYTLGDLASSSSLRRQMTQHDTDSCTSQAGAAAEACSRHAKRQRLDTGQSQLRTVCGSDADAAAKGELDARDFAFPPASRSCTPPEEDAMVPSASRLARAEGSHSQLAALDCCWVPSEAALLGRRDSSSLAAAGGDDMSAHVLPQIAVTPLAEATVPQTRQQQQQQQQQRCQRRQQPQSRKATRTAPTAHRPRRLPPRFVLRWQLPTSSCQRRALLTHDGSSLWTHEVQCENCLIAGASPTLGSLAAAMQQRQ